MRRRAARSSARAMHARRRARSSVGIELHSTYATSRSAGRPADHRPVEEAGARRRRRRRRRGCRGADRRARACTRPRGSTAQRCRRCARRRCRRGDGTPRAAGRPRLSTAICTNVAPPSPRRRALRRDPREVAAGLEARATPSTARAARASCSTMSAMRGCDVVVLRVREAAARSRRGLRAPSRSGRRRRAGAFELANQTAGRAPGSRARGRGRSAPRRRPSRPTFTNLRWRSSNGASFTNTVAGTRGSPRERERARARSCPSAGRARSTDVDVGVQRVATPFRCEVVDVERAARA